MLCKQVANATKKSSPQTVTVEAATSTIGGSAPTQAPQHGKSPSVSLNGKHMQHPAPQVAGGLTIVNGNTAPNPSLHDRKTSVTINPNLIPNGGPAGASGRANNLRFGSMDSQGAPMNNQASLPNQPQSTLGVNPSMNPRTTSPQTSPSPIPQPIASGGRPPSSLQGPGNNLNFGSFGSEPGDMNVRSIDFIVCFYIYLNKICPVQTRIYTDTAYSAAEYAACSSGPYGSKCPVFPLST